MRTARRGLLLLLVLPALALLPGAAPAASPTITLRFDHTTTGFELDGAHRDLPCESCHLDAVFKGTPRDCASCHSRGTRYNATPKPANHILSSDRCDACHNSTAFLPAVHFDHADVRGSCASCHDGVHAAGKPPGHIQTSEPCETCHSTVAWLPAAFDHTGITSGCASCHDGQRATGKGTSHLATSDRCEACHGTNTWQPALRVDHAQVAGSCYSCHNGSVSISTGAVTAKNATHIASSNACESCHATVAWKPVSRVDHGQVTGSCSSCHSGTVPISTGFISGKPTGHIATSRECDTCHTTVAWKPANFNHNGVTGSCVSCHNGTTATGKSATHIVTSDACDSCHNTVVWKPTTRVDHAQVPAAVSGSCISCHNGSLTISTGVVSTKPADAIHQNATQECGTCHTTLAWTPASFDHTGMTGGCSGCHDGSTATGKTPTHLATTSACESCHNTIAWKPATGVDHAQVSGSCYSCHSGSVAISTGTIAGKTATHMATSNGCEACHGTTGWQPATGVDHAQVTGSCVSCHGGTLTISTGSVTAKPATHLATSNVCESCHGTTAWKPATRIDHAQVSGSCISCHSGAVTISTGVITGKPANHPPADNNCQNCHTTTAWLPANFDHNGITGNCFSCHNGTSATGKGVNHITSTSSCESCHNVVAWKPATRVDHTQVSSNCLSCHNGTTLLGTAPTSTGYITGKPADVVHQNTTAQCSTCHTTTAWTPASFDHTGITGSCFSCHNGTNATGKTATHLATSDTCESCHGTTAWKPATRVDHTQATGSCYSCHSGGVTLSTGTVTGKPTTHLSTTNLCESCHTATAWKPATTFDHTQATVTTCYTCHSGSVQISTGYVTGKPANHIATNNACENCHTTNAWKPATFDHANVAPGTCSNCHNGVQATGKPTSHIVTTAECDTCHSTLAWKPIHFDHTGVTSGCAACHDGIAATGKSAGHFVTSRECIECHNTTAWTSVTHVHVSADYPGNHRTALGCTNSACHGGNSEAVTWRTPSYANSCAGCHAGDFRSDPHTKYGSTKYTVSELRNCSGACHIYTDATLTTIRTRRSGPEHRVTDSGFD